MNLKTLSRLLMGYVDFGFFFKLLALYTGRRNRLFMSFEGKEYTYKDVYQEACRYGRLFRAVKARQVEAGRMNRKEALAVGLYMANSPEFLFSVLGAALSGTTIFGINTGFRGETLTNCINQAKCALLIVDGENASKVAQVLPGVEVLGRDDVLLAGGGAEDGSGFKDIEEALSDPAIQELKPSSWFDHWRPLLVIYTSGTTGAPKGVPCSHMKLVGSAFLTNLRIHLKSSDKGYVCMPMFHSNVWLIAIPALMLAGGSFVLKRRFSASAFETDMLAQGITYMNYVGQPLHYILVALERKYGSPEAVAAALANHEGNKFRIAHGNGAPPLDREKLTRYLNMEHIYELYGSSEAPISTANRPGDPIDSLGVVRSRRILILDEEGKPCPPGVLDEKGRLTNYDEAVGEICKKMSQNNVFFDGYFKNQEANSKKFRDGYFHSGDLGHISVVKGKRHLYFDGRTDDWIRKDGENFSAENVQQFAAALPGAALAVAYGAPCEVADEKVMVAVQMQQGAPFDMQGTFDWFMAQQGEGGMDPKWMPDYIRVVDAFEMTHQTQKILVGPLKRQHFNVEKHPDMEVYFRQRGDTAYRLLTGEAFEEIKAAFREIGRLHLLEK